MGTRRSSLRRHVGKRRVAPRRSRPAASTDHGAYVLSWKNKFGSMGAPEFREHVPISDHLPRRED
jgi:hypothetical protein